ncbi:flagellar hook-associated protein FlgK [Shewanella intestini]|uniref:Flagellar hook-associated protein 1 n=1 Tax=Shewanella intestini TaxID=2017544 RepID=A0ABS5HYP4_9GAMM|nr:MULTISPECIES: flagellar hook-associated protein FlgK [Shewanella]MBR9726756.1 flagellar hook-associated protein FlgK [Shewanella intestini]MRG34678.1 flagellar hook-associated protein FlgK [Shewanella sp. XMDDZSB0408]
MSVDLLNISRTGVLAAQSQLSVTSNNIANVNTSGYHRQVASQEALESQRLQGNYLGTGSYVNDVKRIYNEFASRELRISQTSMSEATTTYAKMDELDQVFSNVGKTLPQGLNSLFESINSVAGIPTDIGLRDNVIDNASQLARSINGMQTQVDSNIKQTNLQIESTTKRVNEIGKELGSINSELMKDQTQDPQLLDKQDALINELSQYSQVNVIPLETGAKSIMLGGSVMLVSGEVSMEMGTVTGDPFPNEPRLTANTGDKSLIVDPSKLGGQLGALFDFRDETLIPASNELGQFALGVADSFNTAQTQGFDLNGEVGGDLYRDINDPQMSVGRVGGYSNNTGTANLSVNIDDVSGLTGASYELNFTAPGTYELTDNTTGDVTPLTLNAPGELAGGSGFTINIDTGAMADGDRFEIRPTAGAASGVEVAMVDPKKLAIAGPTITADAANTSKATVSLNGMDPTATGFPGVDSAITFQLNTATNTYTAFDDTGATLGTGTYSPPQVNAFGMNFDVNNTTGATAERFTFDLTFAEGNNNNAVSMAQLANKNIMNGGKSTLVGVYENTKLDIGSKTKASEVRVESANSIYQQANSRVQSESGVNLDEEASNLIRFQQSYLASAKIMSTAQAIFDSLISSVR